MLGFIVCDMIRAGEKKSGKGLVVGFIGRVAREFSMTRQSLAIKPIQATVTITTEPKSATGQML